MIARALMHSDGDANEEIADEVTMRFDGVEGERKEGLRKREQKSRTSTSDNCLGNIFNTLLSRDIINLTYGMTTVSAADQELDFFLFPQLSWEDII